MRRGRHRRGRQIEWEKGRLRELETERVKVWETKTERQICNV